jgi:putative membrane protein
MKRTASILALAALAFAPASAQNGDTLPAQPQTHEADKAAVTFLAQDSVGDVQLGNLALQKSQNAAVRAFAQTLVADHTRSANAAMQVARQTGDTEAKLQPSDETLIEEQHLSQYSGYRFDEEWLTHEIAMHNTDIETVRNAMEVATNVSVMQLERTALQIDEKHLHMANAALDEVERTEGRRR